MATICKYSDICPLFIGEADIEEMLVQAFRERYCYPGNVTCARYAAGEALDPDDVPVDLLPTEHERAARLIAEKC